MDDGKRECAECGGRFHVTKAGVMRSHSGLEWEGRFRVLCIGVGQQPKAEPPPPPRSWTLPPEPPEDVRRLRDKHGRVFDRTDGRYWRNAEDINPYEWPFVDLLRSAGPLTEVVDSEPEPYRCEGCGKTSRIAAHESWCPVYATPLRSARRDRG